MSVEVKAIPTVAEVQESCTQALRFIDSHTLSLSGTIADYPIGRRERGQCRLQVERAAGKGYRTVKTTTNKLGRWCAPKKSTYRNGPVAVIDLGDEQHQIGWLWSSLEYGVYVSYANFDSLMLAKAPCMGAPRREPHHYSMQTSKPISILDIGRGAKPEPGEIRHHVLAADPPELCDAWDAWVECCNVCRHRLLAAWTKVQG